MSTQSPPGIDVEGAWEAVRRRDRSFDGRLVYAVRTTGVYCRPGCPARRPRRGNVRFFEGGEAAREAGFRACLRCHPDGEDPVDELLARAQALLRERRDGDVTLAELGRKVGMSASHLQRTFRARVGMSPREYLTAIRTGRLKAALRDGDDTARAAFDAGFGSASAAYEAADAHLGMSPASYGSGGRGAAIRYTALPCEFGHLLVAVTDRGVCAVTLGDLPEALEGALCAEFPAARIERDSGGELGALCRRIAGFAGEAGEAHELPLDVRGSAFQWEVWRQLRRIPAGATRSYREVARDIGRPTAARAVARACASNRVALLIPCHRVVRNDGSLGGYRWGTELKESLLEAERHALRAR